MHLVLIQESSIKKKRRRKRKRPKKKIPIAQAPVEVPAPQPCKLSGYGTEFMAMEALRRISSDAVKMNEGMKPDRCFLCERCNQWHVATTRVRCAWTGKRRFYSEQHALRFKDRNKDGKNGLKSHYKCKHCNGWHLSSMDKKKHLKIRAEIRDYRRESIQLDWDRRLYGAKHL